MHHQHATTCNANLRILFHSWNEISLSTQKSIRHLEKANAVVKMISKHPELVEILDEENRVLFEKIESLDLLTILNALESAKPAACSAEEINIFNSVLAAS